jgi:hypothetical protein
MLYVSPNLTSPQAHHPISVLRAASAAHRDLTIADRAALAAAWMDNRLVLVPTAELAADAYRVSPATVKRHERRPASST